MNNVLLLVILCVLSQEKFQESLEYVFLLRGGQKVISSYTSLTSKSSSGPARSSTVVRSAHLPHPPSPHCTVGPWALAEPSPLLQTISWFSRSGHRVTWGTGVLSGLPPSDVCEMTSRHRGHHLWTAEQTQVIRKPTPVTSLATVSKQATE